MGISPELLNQQDKRVYLDPEIPCNWTIIASILKKTDYSIEEKFCDRSGKYEHFIDWSDPEQKKADFLVFNQAIEHIVSTLEMGDEKYNESLPKLFETLNSSYLFKILSSKENLGHGEVIGDHIIRVSSLVKTDGLSALDKLILRIAAPFHDLGKAFDISKDRLHFHALISSVIVKQFLIDSEISIKKNFEKLDCDIDYQDFLLKVTEIIRLHHIFEKFDLGVFDLEMLVKIISKDQLSLVLFGLFTIADIGSFVTGESDNKYNGFLIQSVQTFNALLDIIEVENTEEAKALIEFAFNSVSSQS